MVDNLFSDILSPICTVLSRGLRTLRQGYYLVYFSVSLSNYFSMSRNLHRQKSRYSKSLLRSNFTVFLPLVNSMMKYCSIAFHGKMQQNKNTTTKKRNILSRKYILSCICTRVQEHPPLRKSQQGIIFADTHIYYRLGSSLLRSKRL